MMAGGEDVMHPMMDDSPSEMYDDYVPSVVSNANLDDYHAVSSV
jgi:hypothetical protein